MLDRFLDKKRNLYALAIVAIVFESLSSTVLKLGGQYPFLSAGYLFFFCLAVGIMALYAVAWQLLLERLPLTTAYLRKGLTYVLIFVWAAVFFHEQIQGVLFNFFRCIEISIQKFFETAFHFLHFLAGND